MQGIKNKKRVRADFHTNVCLLITPQTLSRVARPPSAQLSPAPEAAGRGRGGPPRARAWAPARTAWARERVHGAAPRQNANDGWT